jgi:hypothetical protein
MVVSDWPKETTRLARKNSAAEAASGRADFVIGFIGASLRLSGEGFQMRDE